MSHGALKRAAWQTVTECLATDRFEQGMAQESTIFSDIAWRSLGVRNSRDAIGINGWC